MKTLRGALTLILTVLSAEPFGQANAADTSRLAQEAIAVFRAAPLVDEGPAPGRCEISTTWGTDAIPEFVAREQFGLHVHADLSTSTTLDGKEIFGRVFSNPDVLCSDKEADAFIDNLKASADPDQKVFRQVHHYSFPVFDDSFKKAVIVRHFSIQQEGGPRDKMFRGGPSFTIVALIFVKRHGSWRFLKTELVAIT